MARMKFLCDAERCIECNACVTACKNEHEVPWGVNRRRVVTIQDGKPGERSISVACMHCSDAPCTAVCPVDCFYQTRPRCGAALEGSVHRLWLLLLCVSVWRAAVSAGRQLWFSGQDGQMYLLCRWSGRRHVSVRIPKYGRTVLQRANCQYVRKCARPRHSSQVMVTPSQTFSASALLLVDLDQVLGDGVQRIPSKASALA